MRQLFTQTLANRAQAAQRGRQHQRASAQYTGRARREIGHRMQMIDTPRWRKTARHINGRLARVIKGAVDTQRRHLIQPARPGEPLQPLILAQGG